MVSQRSLFADMHIRQAQVAVDGPDKQTSRKRKIPTKHSKRHLHYTFPIYPESHCAIQGEVSLIGEIIVHFRQAHSHKSNGVICRDTIHN